MLIKVTNLQKRSQVNTHLVLCAINKAGQLLQLKQIYQLSTTYVPLSDHVAFEFIS